eukprot:scaffold13943_cov61-Phaeocystis_antarctica.AAC.1
MRIRPCASGGASGWARPSSDKGQRSSEDLAEGRARCDAHAQSCSLQPRRDADEDPTCSACTRLSVIKRTREISTWKLQSGRVSSPNPGPSPGNGGELETSLSRFTRNLAR